MTTKERIFRIIQPAEEGDVLSRTYDVVMLVAILASLVPLCFKGESAVFAAIELICTILFIADYFLRLLTADLLLGKQAKSFIAYPFTPAAICDLVSILPGLIEINPAFKVLRVARLLKILRLLRLVRYSKSLALVATVLKKEKNLLLCVLSLAIAYVFVTSMIVFISSLILSTPSLTLCTGPSSPSPP